MACCRFGHRAWARRAAAATSTAFERVYLDHQDALFDYLARRLDATTAERAAAEVLARAWHDFATRDRSVDDRAWIFGLALEHLELHRAAELAHLEHLSAPRNDSASNAHRRGVARALAELDPLDRDMLTLHVWAGVEHETVAGLTGIPAVTARRRIDQAYAFVQRRSDA